MYGKLWLKTDNERSIFMRLDLKKIPFGRRLSRHLIYEETDNSGAGWARGLYLALAAESGGSFIGGPVLGPKGLFRITPVSDGQLLDYNYTASPFMLELTVGTGTIRFALDGAKVLRIEGKGTGLRLDGKLGFGGNGVTTERGIEIQQGGSVYLIKTLKGKAALDCRWNLKALRCTDPVVTVEPDADGFFSLAMYDTDDTYELPELSESFDGAARASEADYNDFRAELADAGPENTDFLELAAYTLWMGFVPFKGKELAFSNKMSDQKIYAVEQPILTLPLKGAVRALEIIGAMLEFASPLGMVPIWAADRQYLYEAVTPVYAAAAWRLMDTSAMKDVSNEQLSAFYNQMTKAVNWWLERRTNDDGLSYYAYRHECAWEGGRAFACDAPAATPDLAAFLTLAAEVLSKMAVTLDRASEAARWDDVARKQLFNLTQTLWDKNAFICMNAFTGDKGTLEGMPGLLPIILGQQLPENISAVLAEKAAKVRWAEAPIIPAALIIMGLRNMGRESEADAVFSELRISCVSGGANDTRGKGIAAGTFYSPAACAALLAAGSGTLQ